MSWASHSLGIKNVTERKFLHRMWRGVPDVEVDNFSISEISEWRIQVSFFPSISTNIRWVGVKKRVPRRPVPKDPVFDEDKLNLSNFLT